MKLYWLGPKMGKTYADSIAMSGVLDIDRLMVTMADILAESLDMTYEEMLINKPHAYTNLLHKLLFTVKKDLILGKAKSVKGTLIAVTGNPALLDPQFNDYFELYLMPHLDEYLERVAVDKEDPQEAFNYYHELLELHNLSKRAVFKDEYLLELIKSNFIKS